MSVEPTTDLQLAHQHLNDWGYCLLANALDENEVHALNSRLRQQALAEQALGEAFEDGGADQQWGAFVDEHGRVRREAFRAKHGGINQRIWMLVNKGQVFVDLIEHKRVLSLVQHVLGDELLISSYTANIARPGGVVMPLHTDQWWMPQPTRPQRRNLPVGSITRTRFDNDADYDASLIAPAACCNVIYMLDDFTQSNGATRIVPGSHLFGRHPDPERDKNIETISACAPKGTALITDGRVWHGTGANTGSTSRHAALITFCGPQFRPQENFVAGTRDEVLASASSTVRALLGFKVWWGYGRTGHPTVDMIDRDEAPLGPLGEDPRTD